MLILNRGKGQAFTVTDKDGNELCSIKFVDLVNGRGKFAIEKFSDDVEVHRSERLEKGENNED
ncbi:hypothetical protein KI655_18605 [Vibrio sp. D404a]|uniref:hypothetical protein n=1 Tax=unclassified Vibrio TaxID=2614977 RepID=UPI0025543892|nr:MULTISPECIES: hypothetical protein [unclassified Vibrio]MDK9739310.1 hypothetical protein [Vibrio sp. D404a]MDK9797654.1 hypothetical protein [Vibrio sp. D449a]